MVQPPPAAPVLACSGPDGLPGSTATDGLAAARSAYRRRAWPQAYAAFRQADRMMPLGAPDAERLAVSGYLTGAAEWAELWTRAYDAWLRDGERQRAARCAFWLAFGLLDVGEQARGSGWLTRAEQLLDDAPGKCAERGYVLVPRGIACLASGAPSEALGVFAEVDTVGRQCGEPDLVVLGCLGRGQALVELGRAEQGVPLLDEAMVVLTSNELTPMVAGLVCCAAIEVFQGMFDLERAREWTTALSRWCDAQPGLVPYRGQCLVHRAEILQLHGQWDEAAAEAERACVSLASRPAVGDAHYRRAELHRLRGELRQAEHAYRQATRAGREPQPGLALLRLCQGRVDVAAAAMRRVLDETSAGPARAHLLPPAVEVALGAGQVSAARAAADELSAAATQLDVPVLHAAAGQAAGAVLLAEGDARGALPVLRRAWAAWRAAEAPYDAARVRVLVASACLALGDEDTAAMELDAARTVLAELGARPELAKVAALTRRGTPGRFGALTAREVEVLVLVAGGKTNRRIAAELFISEKTVARHLSNVFDKLGIRSRSAAVAWAYEHRLV